VNKVHYSSKKDDWETPTWLFEGADKEFGFTLDVCATAKNAKCKKHFNRKQDGLKQDWRGEMCWMNPPYGREIGEWVEKARNAGTTVVALLPARTDTRWWHEHIWDTDRGKPQRNVEVMFIRGRLRFKGAPHPAPFPSCIVIFR
jgi:phage N-6-adenine-methyltransferase